MRFAPGTNATMTTTVTNAAGNVITPDSIVVDLFDPNGLKVVDDGIPTALSTGLYRYVYPLTEDAVLGLWRIEWKVTLSGKTAYGDEVFEVLEADVIVNPSQDVLHSQLRSRLGETKDPEGDGSETFFRDTDISDILAYADDDLDLATLEGWRRKMARYARLVDVNESGADRKMSQKFKNAKDMVAFWSKLAGAAVIDRQNALAGRVVGRAVNLRCDSSEPVLTPFSGYSEHVREYPTHRLLIPAIMG